VNGEFVQIGLAAEIDMIDASAYRILAADDQGPVASNLTCGTDAEIYDAQRTRMLTSRCWTPGSRRPGA
jgi:hypothetical protein